MKRLILGCMLLLAIGTRSSAQVVTTTSTATGKVTYWYYPTYNIYYNEATGDYWYYDEPTIKWIYSKELPTTYVISDKDVRYKIDYAGTDVWKANKTHKIKYKVKKNGRVKDKS